MILNFKTFEWFWITWKNYNTRMHVCLACILKSSYVLVSSISLYSIFFVDYSIWICLDPRVGEACVCLRFHLCEISAASDLIFYSVPDMFYSFFLFYFLFYSFSIIFLCILFTLLVLHFILLYSILCSILFCLVQLYLLFYSVLSFVLFYSCFCSILFHSILFHSILSSILSFFVPFYSILLLISILI